MPRITILIGLPASGETTHLKTNFASLYPNNCFDDFHSRSMDGTRVFNKSRCHEDLMKKIKNGEDCIISDVEYCREWRLLEAESGLKELGEKISVRIETNRVYLENNPNACRHNVVHRYHREPDRDYMTELYKVDCLSSVYRCPEEFTPVIVKTCCNKEPNQY